VTGEIIRLKKPKLQLPAVLESTAASGAPSDDQMPVFETNLQETLGIRKFIEMSMADLRTQLEKAARDGTPKHKFAAMKQNAFVITAWLTSALMMVDGMLASAALKENKPLADEMRTDDQVPAA
jgi:hypothetical protein